MINIVICNKIQLLDLPFENGLLRLGIFGLRATYINKQLYKKCPIHSVILRLQGKAIYCIYLSVDLSLYTVMTNRAFSSSCDFAYLLSLIVC